MERDRFKGIDTFVAVVDAGSIAAAAVRLALTPSAVGKAIARLEARLGTKLIDRTTRQMALTDDGRAFYATSLRLISELDEAEKGIAQQRTIPVGTLRVDMPVFFGRLRVMPLLRMIVNEHPQLKLSASFTDRMVDILEEGLDLVVRIGSGDPPNSAIATRPLGSERLVFAASPAYLGQRGGVSQAKDLVLHRCLGHRRADGQITPWLLPSESGRGDRMIPNAHIVASSVEALIDASVAGAGVGQFATWAIRDRIESGELLELLPDWSPPGLPVSLLWPISKQLNPRVSLAIESLTRSMTVQ